ncbi:hypothetical protein Y1Q_0023391 [Alligator mississippiensis]|uniref:Uncharacterized protein n=1 Tax=Alligator mississippiensis TaxID=8496 RepID=A0A151NQB5_ALLMI|nr:hypothetical protein Y1Q_0023391 [Alligator mississippiensis]
MGRRGGAVGSFHARWQKIDYTQGFHIAPRTRILILCTWHPEAPVRNKPNGMLGKMPNSLPGQVPFMENSQEKQK